MTGGSGVLTAVPLPRLPTIMDVALLPERRVVEVERAVERWLGLLLPAKDCQLPENDLGVVTERLLRVGLSGTTSEGSVETGKLCGCHICSMALPVFSGLVEPLKDQDTLLLFGYQTA